MINNDLLMYNVAMTQDINGNNNLALRVVNNVQAYLTCPYPKIT